MVIKKINESEFNPKLHVKEYKRKCRQCGKIWHSLASREERVKSDIFANACATAGFCGNPSAMAQTSRNANAQRNELERLKSCPKCGSQNYKEEVVIYSKDEEEEVRETFWECEKCGKNFKNKKTAETHEKGCRKRK